MINRRRFLATSAALAPAAAVGFSAGAALAQEKAYDVAKLMAPGPLPDMAEGAEGAKVTMIEYMSMTCSHCAHFDVETLPKLRAKYIDTGKLRFIIREFPLDPLAAAAFMLARNAPGGRYFDVVNFLFKTQNDWAFVPDPVTALRNEAKQFGYSPATFDATLSDQKLLDGINAMRERGAKEFGVDATPTFFINGTLLRGAASFEEFSTRIDQQLS